MQCPPMTRTVLPVSVARVRLAPGAEVVCGNDDASTRIGQQLSFRHGKNAFVAVVESSEDSRFGGAALQPEMLFQRFARYRALMVSPSK